MMMKSIATAVAAAWLFLCAPALAASLRPGPGVTVQVPDGWKDADRDFGTLIHPAVRQALSCVDTDPEELRHVGWLLDGNTLQGAYCVSFRQSGMGKALHILKSARGGDREAAAAKFADTFAGILQAGYSRRGIQVEAMNAEIFDAGADVIMVMDGLVRSGSERLLRSETVFLHGDSMLSIGAVHAEKAPQTVAGQLEAIPLSVQWKK